MFESTVFESIVKQTQLADPVATTGDRVYLICSQNGLFPDPWHGHVPHEMWGIWNHPIKLLDGFWLALHTPSSGVTRWLTEADVCRVGLGYTEFAYTLEPIHVTRRDFVPDGVEGCVVTLTVALPAHWEEPLTAVVQVRSDLRPAWLGERVGLHDAPDQVSAAADRHSVLFTDSANPWCAVVGADQPASAIQLGEGVTPRYHTHGQGVNAAMFFPLTPQPDGQLTLTLLIAGSAQGTDAARATFTRLQAEHGALLAQKQALYRQIAAQSQLASPNPALDEALQWVKLNCQMLARRTEAHGLGVGAGLPTYPWWFGIDTEYAVLPMLQAGLFDLVKASLRMLKTVSETTNAGEPGRVIHELATTGVVYNEGNLVETPAFTRAVHQTWLWTGDRAFLAEMYPFCKQGILEYTLGQCDPDGDLCPAGRSIIETLEMHAGFETIDIASYTWEALGRLADMAQAVEDQAIIPQLEEKADQLGKLIRNEWWLPDEGLFADLRATLAQVHKVLQHLDDLAAQHPSDRGLQDQVRQAHRLLDSPLTTPRSAFRTPHDDLPWLLRHWVVMCPVEVGLATLEQAQQVLQRLRSAEFGNEWGMYLHPDRPDVMSINTGLLALAHARYGQIDPALDLALRLTKTLHLHMPGAISEAQPNQWCFLQLWSALGIVSPVVEGIFGIAPRVHERKLRVVPHFPTGWEQMALSDLRVGEAYFTLHATRNPHHYTLTVTTDSLDYVLELGFYLPAEVTIQQVTRNGQPIPWRWEETHAGRALLCTTQGNSTLVVQI